MSFIDEIVNQNGFFKSDVDYGVVRNSNGEISLTSVFLSNFESNELEELLFTKMTTYAEDVKKHLEFLLADNEPLLAGNDEYYKLKEKLEKAVTFTDIRACVEEYWDLPLSNSLEVQAMLDELEDSISPDSLYLPRVEEYKESICPKPCPNISIHFYEGETIKFRDVEISLIDTGFLPRVPQYDKEIGSYYETKRYLLELTGEEAQKFCQTVANEVFDAMQNHEELFKKKGATAEETYDFIKAFGFTAEQDVQKSSDKELE